MTIELKVNGKPVTDFSKASVRLSMESFAHTFAFTFSDKWLGTGYALKLPFKEFDPCEVSIDGVKVLDGYLEDIPLDYDEKNHTIAIAGLSQTGHMVESSALHTGGSWRNVSALIVCQDIAKPFGVTVSVDLSALAYINSPPLGRWAIEEGETAFSCVMRVLQDRGCFAISGSAKDLIVTRAGALIAPGLIELGVSPILSASCSSRFRERHSFYQVQAQDVHGAKAYLPDPSITVYRPLVIVSDGGGGFDDRINRARWELTTRVGKSRRLRYRMQGHKTLLGLPWQLNTRMAVRDRFLEIDDTLLICGLQFDESKDAGTVTTVELCKPEAFDVLAPVPKQRKLKGL